MAELQDVRRISTAGRLLTRTLDLEFDAANFKVDFRDVLASDKIGLQILKEERAKFERESADNSQATDRRDKEMDRRKRHGEAF